MLTIQEEIYFVYHTRGTSANLTPKCTFYPSKEEPYAGGRRLVLNGLPS